MSKNTAQKDFLEDYEKSLDTLEDIQRLSEFSLSPLISRIYFHLSEMKRKAEAERLTLVNPYETINKVLDEKFENIIHEYFGNKLKFKNYDYQKSIDKIDLKKWNLILEVIPEFLSIVSLFNYHGQVDISLDNRAIEVSGLILEDGQVEHNRKFIYLLTRKLLSLKTLLVFKLNKTERTGLFKLDLKLDLSYDEESVYEVKFHTGDFETLSIGFPNLFCDYQSSSEQIVHSGEHNIIEIYNDLTIDHKFGMPDFSSLESSTKEILHFPFIFRPVSIILPISGSQVKDSVFRNKSKNFEDDYKEQDVSNYFQKFDFFSLFKI